MNGSRFVDTHAHLAMLEHSPLPEILDRARAAGITKMITVSTDEASWEANRNIAKAEPHVYYSLGLHPHDAARWAECAAKLEGQQRDSKCVAVGEMGLDFHYGFSPREAQIEALEAQLRLAKQWDLPVIVHCREAFPALFSSIKKIGLSSRGGVMHCFTGTALEAKEALDLGFKISFSGIVTFKNAQPLRETVKLVPQDSLLVETDCPFLAPIPNRGKPNEPSYLPLTAATIAQARGITLEQVAEVTTKNALEFFRLI